jgi:hypothetical protein
VVAKEIKSREDVEKLQKIVIKLELDSLLKKLNRIEKELIEIV